jgi:hypothetical protein
MTSFFHRAAGVFGAIVAAFVVTAGATSAAATPGDKSVETPVLTEAACAPL